HWGTSPKSGATGSNGDAIVATLVRRGLDVATVNMMIASEEGDILYLNEAAREMFTRAESAIRKQLPHFSANALLGANMDSFHPDPRHQRALMSNLNATHRTRISVGGQTFDLVATPVFGQDGKRLGAVIEWKDATLETKIEREVAGIVASAVEGDLTGRIPLDDAEGSVK